MTSRRALEFLERFRIACGGVLVDDISDGYNRVHDLFEMPTASESRGDNCAEGFGQIWETNLDTTNFDGIQGGQSQTVHFKLLYVIFNQNQDLPVQCCPMSIESEFGSLLESLAFQKS